eukprot:5661748-Ditylum_brightwellii.AAC.1
MDDMENNLGIMAGNIGNSFCTAPCAEKIWSVVGDDFGPRKGSVVTLKRVLYDEYEGYDYLATHVDDIIIVAKNPI